VLEVCLGLYRNHSKHNSSVPAHAVRLASSTGEISLLHFGQIPKKEIEMKQLAKTVLNFRPTARQLAVIGFSLLLAAPAFAQAANSPWENAVNVLQTAFTSTIARGLSLVAIVVAGLTFAFGEGGSKKVLAGVLFGVGMAIAAVNFIAWLFPGN
jgi:type IV secretory pathway VirB2 component (pilin)